MKQIKLLAVLMALVLLCTSATNQKTTTIFIIGDSTAAKKDLSKGSPETRSHSQPVIPIQVLRSTTTMPSSFVRRANMAASPWS